MYAKRRTGNVSYPGAGRPHFEHSARLFTRGRIATSMERAGAAPTNRAFPKTQRFRNGDS